MHFWINKPAGRYYGFSGRRYPATPMRLKTRSGQCRHSGEFRQMVTPVHRFQSLSSAANTAGPSCTNVYRPARSTLRGGNENRNTLTNNLVQQSQLNNTPNNVTNAGNNQLILSNNTSNGTNRSLLDFSEFSDAELAGYRLRCGVWITFVLATGFVAAAKIYFGHQGPGLEILVFCGLLTLLLSACFYSILCRRSHVNSLPEHHVQDEQIASLTNTRANIAENIRPIPAVRQNPPPPYHIAILIPPTNSMDEAPPPSYDKVMR